MIPDIVAHTGQLMDVKRQITLKLNPIGRFVDSPTDFQRLELDALFFGNLLEESILIQSAVIDGNDVRAHLIHQLIRIVHKRTKSRQYLVEISALTRRDLSRRLPRNGHIIRMK